MGNQRLLKGMIVVACLLAAVCGILLYRSGIGEMTLVNASGETVLKATGEVGGRKFEFTDIPADETRTVTFRAKGMIRYQVAIEFHYERKLDPEPGSYISSAGSRRRLVIQHDHVVMESSD